MPQSSGNPTPDFSTAISPQNGNMAIHQATTGWDQYSASGLTYQSNDTSPHPILSVNAGILPGAGEVIYSAEVTVHFGTSIVTPTYYYNNPSFPSTMGATTFSVPIDASGLPTGTYAWGAQVTYHYRTSNGDPSSDSTMTILYPGQKQSIVNRTQSPYGNGWWIDGLDQLTFDSGGATYVTGDGYAAYFAVSGTNTFATPAGWYDTLVRSGSNYILTTPQKTSETFNASGQMTSQTDAGGNVTTYVYNASGTLAYVIRPDHSENAFGYNGNGNLGLIARYSPPGTAGTPQYTSVQDVGGQLTGTTALGLQNTNPNVTLPTTFGYSSQTGLLTTSTSASGVQTTYAYDSFRRFASLTHGADNSTYQVSSIESAKRSTRRADWD